MKFDGSLQHHSRIDAAKSNLSGRIRSYQGLNSTKTQCKVCGHRPISYIVSTPSCHLSMLATPQISSRRVFWRCCMFCMFKSNCVYLWGRSAKQFYSFDCLQPEGIGAVRSPDKCRTLISWSLHCSSGLEFRSSPRIDFCLNVCLICAQVFGEAEEEHPNNAW